MLTPWPAAVDARRLVTVDEKGDPGASQSGRRQQPRHRRVPIDSLDAHPLVARGLSAHDRDRPLWDVEHVGKKSDEGVVGGAVDRRGREADK
jgi:hypothetical protein